MPAIRYQMSVYSTETLGNDTQKGKREQKLQQRFTIDVMRDRILVVRLTEKDKQQEPL